MPAGTWKQARALCLRTGVVETAAFVRCLRTGVDGKELGADGGVEIAAEEAEALIGRQAGFFMTVPLRDEEGFFMTVCFTFVFCVLPATCVALTALAIGMTGCVLMALGTYT